MYDYPIPAFAPHEALVSRILALWNGPNNDGSHDWNHLIRVWKLARQIAADEPEADVEILAAATLLHDCVAIEKNDPRRQMASRLSAEKARNILLTLGWDSNRSDRVAHVIAAHSYSAGIVADSIEALILRDADRLDAIGAIGIARTFYVGGRMGSLLYEPADPLGQSRPLNDQLYALDHFEAKLLHLTDQLHSQRARQIGEQRRALMQQFIANLIQEINPQPDAKP